MNKEINDKNILLGVNLWSPLSRLMPPTELGVQGEDGQNEGGHQDKIR